MPAKKIKTVKLEDFLKKNLGYLPDIKIRKNIGYKACGGNIVKLQILGENNEKRCNVKLFPFEKFRCSKARVLKIFPNAFFRKTLGSIDDLQKRIMEPEKSEINQVSSNNDKNFKYAQGKIVKEPKYCKTQKKVCASGIHYYPTLLAAQTHTAKIHNKHTTLGHLLPNHFHFFSNHGKNVRFISKYDNINKRKNIFSETKYGKTGKKITNYLEFDWKDCVEE